MSKSIQFSTRYDHPIDKVWDTITDPEAMSVWLMPTNFQPILGYEFEFKTKPTIGFDGITKCKVVSLDPPHHLAFTWSGGNLKDTLVSFKLTSIDDKSTRLDFEHSGFEGFMNTVLVRRILARGWKRKILTVYLPKQLKL